METKVEVARVKYGKEGRLLSDTPDQAATLQEAEKPKQKDAGTGAAPQQQNKATSAVGGKPASNSTTGGARPVQSPASAPKVKPVPFYIKPIVRHDRYLKLMIYSDYGVGKTTLAASAADVPEMCDVVFIDAEAGSMSIDPRSTIELVDIATYAQFARVHEFLRLHCQYRDAGDENALRRIEARIKQVPEEEIKKPRKYKTAVIDSLTEVQKYCMYQLLGISVGEFALDMEPDSPQYAEWGKSAEMIRLLVRSFRNLPMNIIVVCARQMEQDEKKRFHYLPALPGKLANEVMGFFDAVGYYVQGGVEQGGEVTRRLWLTPGQTFKAKNRFTGFRDAYIDNPTMADLWKLKNT